MLTNPYHLEWRYAKRTFITSACFKHAVAKLKMFQAGVRSGLTDEARAVKTIPPSGMDISAPSSETSHGDFSFGF